MSLHLLPAGTQLSVRKFLILKFTAWKLAVAPDCLADPPLQFHLSALGGNFNLVVSQIGGFLKIN